RRRRRRSTAVVIRVASVCGGQALRTGRHERDGALTRGQCRDAVRCAVACRHVARQRRPRNHRGVDGHGALHRHPAPHISRVPGCRLTDGSGLFDVIVVVVLAFPTVTVLVVGELLPSALSTITFDGSTCAIPPPRGFWNVPAACGVALKTTSNLLTPRFESKV